MRPTRKQLIMLLILALLLLVGTDIFGSWLAPLLGDADHHLQHYLLRPLFRIGKLPVTALLVTKLAMLMVALMLSANFMTQFLQKHILVHTALQPGQQFALARVTSYMVVILGLIIGLESIGLNLSSLLVVGGALGIGIGFGLQSIMSNFVAGLLLLLEQPIRLGDRVEIGNTFGDVVQMRARSTWVRTNDNVVIIVPNSDFINSRVTNWTANDREVRVSLSVGVSYHSDPGSVRESLLRVARAHPDVLSEPAPEVIFVDFGESSLDFELRIWTVQQVQTPMRLKSDLYFAIFAAFRKEGIELPFPQRDLNLKSISEPLLSRLMVKGEAE